MSTVLRRAIYGKLAGDNTLIGLLGAAVSGFSQSIYYEGAPEHAQFPYVVFTKQTGTPTYALKNGGPIFDSELWLIKGVDRSRTADGVDAISSRLADLLNDASLSISGRSLMYLRRDSDIDYLEVHDGVLYRHSGCVFRITSSPS